MSVELLKPIAVQNALSCIRGERRFPAQVFLRDWADYLFFDPSILFEAGFIEVKSLLLRQEDSYVIAMINLGNGGTQIQAEVRAIYLERTTTSKEYISELMGDGSPMSWLFLMDRYVLASERGHWSIYCEKENDVAVLAVDESVSEFTCSQLAKTLNAKSIGAASVPSRDKVFDFHKLIPEWKSALSAEYKPLHHLV